jgi:undecaprenyl phosphate-alpha-L-ara4N flippase subunit ArnE
MNLMVFGMICVVTASQLEAAMHLAFKRATVESASRNAMAGIHALTRAPGWMSVGLMCFVLEALFYSVGLRFLDLNIAFPASSLTFVGVVFLSWLWFAEAIGLRRWTGVGLIVAGMILLGLS